MGGNVSYCPTNGALPYDGESLCVARSLQYIPQLLFVALALPSLLYLHRSPPPASTLHFPLHAVRWILMLVLLLVSLVEAGQVMIFNSQFYGREAVPVGLYLPLLVNVPLVACTFTVAHMAEIRQRSGFLFVLVVVWICSCATRAALIHDYSSWPDSLDTDIRPKTCFVIAAIYVLLLAADSYVLIIEWVKSKRSNYNVSASVKEDEDDEANMVFRDAYVNLFSKVTYWWFGKQILQVGFKKPLEMSDLGPVSKKESSDAAYKAIKSAWQKELTRAQIGCRKPSLIRALGRVFWKTTAFAGLLLLIANSLLFYGPLAVNLIVKYVEDYEAGTLPDYADTITLKEFFSNGYVVAVTVFFTTVISSVIMQCHHLIMFRVGVMMQTGIRAMVYEKALRLANWSSENSGLTTGLLLNHMSSDTESFPHLGFLLNQAWATPLTVVVAIILLVLDLGWSALIACGVIIVLLPVQGKVAAVLARYQRKTLRFSDNRLKKVNELLQGIKLLKLYAWEESFRKAIEIVRNSELRTLLRLTLMRAFILFFTTVTPILITLVTFGLYTILEDDPLTANKAFTALALFNLMRTPLLLIPFLVNMSTQSYISLQRLSKFFQARELTQPLQGQTMSLLRLESRQNNELPAGVEVQISDGSFCWDPEQQEPTLSDISLSFPKGKLTMVVGRVGSGKSSLLSALLGEMTTLSGTVTWNDEKSPIAFGAQKAWLLNDTLKQNILFGGELDDEKYRAVVEACALVPDLEMLPAGDKTEIGERGINLSGGQKQRVSVARAIYSNSRVVVLDDPLSAVDVHVAEQMFEKGIIELLLNQGRTVILVTHHLRYLQQADMIVVMEHGRVSHSGTYDQICQKDAHMRQVFQHCDSLEDEGDGKDEEEEEMQGPPLQHQMSRESAHSTKPGTDEKLPPKKLAGGNLMSKEERETGAVGLRVYLRYFQSYGILLAFLVACSAILSEGLQAGTDFWLSDWSTANTSDPTEEGTSYYIGGYGILSSLTVLAGLFLSLLFGIATVRASRNLHSSMLNRIVLAPMRFFETTPVGRILNRFSSDTKIMDSILPITVQFFTQTSLRIVTAFVVQAIVTPFFLLAGIPILILFYLIQRYFRESQREIQRLVSISRSPIYANFSEMLSGLTTIRAYRYKQTIQNSLVRKVVCNFVSRQGDFRKKVREKISSHAGAMVFLQTGNRWLGVRLDIVGALTVFFAAISSLSTALAGSIGAGLVGLAVSYSLKIAVILNWLVRHISDTEVNMTAVERIDSYSRMDVEPQPSPDDIRPPENWPNKGAVEIRNLQVRYSQELNPVLLGVNISIGGGEKVGICGRTGSGKSSMMLGLFRMIDICKGDVVIDDINISKVALRNLRSQLAIIPQDPVLFAGSVRYNLDPLGRHSDTELWQSLEVAQLHTVVSGLGKGLDSEVSESGDNFSVGQRQLFCLARAFLRKTQILVMDEATSSVDMETDALIQKVIRSAFAERTVLTIAHRVSTILDSDRILVLDEGKLIENDSPHNLLSRPGSVFASLVQSNK